MRPHLLSRSLVLISTLLLLGCGSDDDSGSTATLTEDQAAAVIQAINNATSQGAGVGIPTTKTISLAQSTTQVNSTVQCSGGGEVTVIGTSTTTTSSGSIEADLELTETLVDCVSVGDDSQAYTLNGPLTVSADLSLIETAPSSLAATFATTTSGTLSIVGGEIDVSNCAIAVTISSTISVDGSSVEGSAQWNGTVCSNASTGSTSF